MEPNEKYKMLEASYARSLQVCDPIDFQMRQQQLLRMVAHYLLDRDKPQVEEKIDEQSV